MTGLIATAESVTKTYQDGQGRRVVLDDVDLRVDAGQIVGIEGPSGCGKTTLLSIIAGLLRPDDGQVVVAGEPVDYDRPGDVANLRRRHIGLVSQAFGLIDDESVLANISLPLMFERPRPSRRERRSVVEQSMRWAALDIDPTMTVAKLSRGEKQRVAIARALVRTPSLVVADEPSAALDAETGERIVARLRTLAEGGTGVLVATHDPQVSAACDVVHRLVGGRLIPRADANH